MRGRTLMPELFDQHPFVRDGAGPVRITCATDPYQRVRATLRRAYRRSS